MLNRRATTTNGLLSHLAPHMMTVNSVINLCMAGLYAAHDLYRVSLPCVKLSPTCHTALGRCGEARCKATHLHDLVSSSLVYTVFVSKAPICAFCILVADCMLSYWCIYYVVFFATCSIAIVAPAAS